MLMRGLVFLLDLTNTTPLFFFSFQTLLDNKSVSLGRNSGNVGRADVSSFFVQTTCRGK